MEAKTLNTAAGQRIRLLRKMLGLSQTDLAKRVDISYQQLQKYETGKNNISLSMLESISRGLGADAKDVALERGLDNHELLSALLGAQDQGDSTQSQSGQILSKLHALEDPHVKRSLLKLLDVLALETVAKE